ncbi:MAG: DUF6737 family protein [Leptolyngbyaceae bacterium]|nr:DUF6737 family protein [Leptolyngbyaceae bacterium]
MTQTERSPQPSSQYASIWSYKPWWCQPWSIVLTGVSIIGGSWYVFKVWWLTGLLAIPTLTWMFFFLGVYPRLMKDFMATPHEPESHSS